MNKLNHLAIILDGNGRWATKQNLPRIKGHYEGAKNVKVIAIACSKKDIKRLTVFAFSTENWKRPQEEVNYIFKLPKLFFDMYLKDLMKYQIRLDYIGDLDSIDAKARKAILNCIDKTKDNKGMVLCFALNYGSYQEIVRSTRLIANDIKNGIIDIDDINEELISNHLYNKMPVDLLIRTSNELRISNFLLWQIAYSELYFSKVLWPDFNEEELNKALDDYDNRDRRYGGLTNEK